MKAFDIPLLKRNLKQARALAHEVVCQKGAHFTPHTFWDKHFQRALSYLRSQEAKDHLKRFTLPVANPYIEKLVRLSLGLFDGQKLENIHLQESVASALLCPLRQIVGSCFATAPAIFIQTEQPERLILDLYDLMMTAQLKRTLAGQECVVPISPTWGERGNDHPLLRVWEYTLASFSDYKTKFSSWSLYQSLGLDPKDQGGIGAFIYSILQEKLDDANKKVEQLHFEYLRAVDETRLSRSLLQNADSSDRIKMRKKELEMRSYHMQGCKNERDKVYENAQSLSQFFPFIIKHYTEKFQEYFFEIYDADIKPKEKDVYEDSPAGFRLCYKHGRSDPLAWTMVRTKEEFIAVLREFFLAVEPHICSVCEWSYGAHIIQELTTAIIHFIQTKEFLTFALREKRPWSYTSGGNMHSLLKGYYCMEGEITEEKRVIENPTDLLTFLLDLLKKLPYSVTKVFETDPLASLLMYSPSHAFLLKPGLSPFKEGWLDTGFTYTWIRDHVIDPAKKHYHGVFLDQEMQIFIASKVIQEGFFPHESPLSLSDFRIYLTEIFLQETEKVDHLIYQSFPPLNPLVFADTNWEDYLFAFAVNPVSLELDLYRVSSDGSRAFPMTSWRPYLDGTTSYPWGVLTSSSDFSHASFSDISLKIKKI